MDIWQCIRLENIELPNLYFSHDRAVFGQEGMLLAKTDFINLLPDEKTETRTVRFRTIGDATCTGAVESTASSLEDIIAEVAAAQVGERGGRADDRRPWKTARNRGIFK